MELKSQKGVALVGVLVTSVIGIIIFQGLFTMNAVTMKSTKQIEGKLQSASINRAILETLSEGKPEDDQCATAGTCESACTNTLEGSLLDGSVVEITEIKTAYNETKYPAVTTSTPALDVGERVRYKKDQETGGVKINKIEFTGNKDTKQGELKVYYEFVVLGKTETPAPFVFPVTIQTHQPNADDNTKEELLTCGIEAGSGGEPTPCYKVTKDGHTIVGCDSTGEVTGASAPNTSTIFGFEAGKVSTATENTFIGYQAGYSNIRGKNNIFLGYQAGYSNIGRPVSFHGIKNIFIGDQAGYLNKEGSWNTFLGYQAGYSSIGVNSNIFIGEKAGYLFTSGRANIFIGDQAGRYSTSGKNNIFLGYQAGLDGEGEYNIFLGYMTGRYATGKKNIYIGYDIKKLNDNQSGQLQIGDWIKGSVKTETTGEGDEAISTDKQQTLTFLFGNKTSDAKVVVEGDLEVKGNLTCTGTTCGGGITKTDLHGEISQNHRDYNLSESIKNFDLILIRGLDTSTDDMAFTIFDPDEITSNSSQNQNNTLGIFSDNANTHRLFFYFKTNTQLRVYHASNFKIVKIIGLKFGSTTTTASSRVYKQNISPFKDYESSLGVIMDTPLFNYQYKKNYIFYDTEVGHTRMGVISEELPDSLQIKEEGKPSVPDWVSVYGTLWAGIKALASRTDQIDELKKEIKASTQELKKLRQELLKAKNRIDKLEKATPR